MTERSGRALGELHALARDLARLRDDLARGLDDDGLPREIETTHADLRRIQEHLRRFEWHAPCAEAKIDGDPEPNGRSRQMKELRCADVGFDCEGVIRAEDEEQVMAQAAQHAREAHGLTDADLNEETVGAIRAQIHDA